MLVSGSEIVRTQSAQTQRLELWLLLFLKDECCARRKEYEEWFPGTVKKALTKYKMRILYGEGRVVRSLPAFVLATVGAACLSCLGVH